LFIPDPDPDFLPTPDPGSKVKKAPDSGIRNTAYQDPILTKNWRKVLRDVMIPFVEGHGEAAVDELPVVQRHRDEASCVGGREGSVMKLYCGSVTI
jgi:hypothetical protein